MFGKKTSEKDSSPDIETNDIETKEESSGNIFDEFNSDDSLLSEVEKLKEEQNRDVFFYLSIAGTILQNLFILMFLFIILGKVYISLQNNKQVYNKGFLDPICSFVIGDVPKPENTTLCSSVAYTQNYYNTELDNIKKQYSTDILLLIEKIYKAKNFSKTKEVSFLLEKGSSKLEVLDILDRFDKLKNEYLGIEKRRIQCNNVVIDSLEMTLSMSCTSYSKGYEGNIIGFSGNKSDATIGGTSISVANSFLNYIEKTSEEFSLLDRQRIFFSTNEDGEKNGYTMSTPFDIKLKINF